MHATRLSDSVLIVTGDFGQEHMTVVSTGDGLVIADTLATLPATRAALPLVREFSREPVRVVVSTHLDVDHVAGNHVFAGSTLVAHANGTRHLDERVFDSPESERETRALVSHLQASDVPADPVLAARRQTYIDMYTSLLEGFGDFVAAPPFVFTPGGATIQLGGKAIHLHHVGPAHSDADLVVVVPDDELVVTGDVALGHGFAPVAHAHHGGSVIGLGDALARIEALTRDATRVVPGHGAVGGRLLLGEQRRYVDGLLAAVREAQAQGLTLEAARPSLEMPEFSRHLLYDFVHPGHVSLAWAEVAVQSGPR